mmetsp:Transcript_16471/g.51760  ORF Transcript_16471/g.51760 Transcript_16471/m.51760 type:complete len:205 (-) Transcript_16471:31-645(-)
MTPPGLPMGRPRSSQITASAGSRGMGAGTTPIVRLEVLRAEAAVLGAEAPEVREELGVSECRAATSTECADEHPSSSASSWHGTTVTSEASPDTEVSCTAFMGAWKARAARMETTEDLRETTPVAAPTVQMEQTEERRRWTAGLAGAKGGRGATVEEVLLVAQTAGPSDFVEAARLTATSSSLGATASGLGPSPVWGQQYTSTA